MSTGIDIKYVRETYQEMPDEELIRVATQEANGLTAEAIEVIEAEIKKRGLQESIMKGVAAQNKEYTIEEINKYCDVMSVLPCPVCSLTTKRLNATMTAETASFLIFTNYQTKIKIGCADCLDRANSKAVGKTMLLGWWGIPWGIIRSIQSISINAGSKASNHSSNHNKYFQSFVLAKIGEIETYKEDKGQLQQIISNFNRP